jgi:hypothetical protein
LATIRTTVLLFLAACAPVATAQVTYSTLSASGGYNHSFYYGQQGNPTLDVELAWQFTPSITGDLSQLRLSLFAEIPFRECRLAIYSDDAGNPGGLLWSTQVIPPTNSNGSLPAWTLPISAGPHLVAGTSYFYSVSATQLNDWEWWCGTPLTNVQERFRDHPTDPWGSEGLQYAPGIEMTVPTPSSVSVLGLVALGSSRRRRK